VIEDEDEDEEDLNPNDEIRKKSFLTTDPACGTDFMGKKLQNPRSKLKFE
jgi:hypothetical protein